MKTNNKTLAYAQPGGRVRLGDQAERAKFEAWAESEGEGIGRWPDGFYIRECTQVAWESWKAALSAQPSPGETLPPDMRLGSADYLDYLDSKPSPGGQGGDPSIEKQARELLAAVYEQAEETWAVWTIRNSPMDQLIFSIKGALLAIIDALAALQPVGDQHQDDLAVDAFAAAMKAKMAEGRGKGRGGWEDPAQCTADDLSRMLRDHVDKGDPRDVANFCMMLDQRGEAIAARQPLVSNQVLENVEQLGVDSDSQSSGISGGLPVDSQPVGVDDTTDRALGETIDQRDRCEEVADELADQIARITGVDIGEHSSANCPWQNAIEAAEEYKPAQAVDPVQFLELAQEVRVTADDWTSRGVAGNAVLRNIADRLLALTDSQAVGK